ncbi:MAG: phenylacetate-CoA oxygenase subunit PaaJ [Phycisphaerales bacterium]|jgi:ring-1,2-phenylacetyl-CoA epoxidase subunit PaaD|nr:phenylacetate-CoA oxygenase subunit PaaJ [Phycisphaerales bacterium]
MVTAEDIWAALDEVPDPELPVSIVELGMVEHVDAEGEVPTVHLIPTYTGCPALPMIERDVHARVGAIEGVRRCTIQWRFEPPWTPDRITDTGRAKLADHGVTTPQCGHADPKHVPLHTSAIPCPYCGSSQTRLDSPFGPTRCRAIHFCDACRNQFEHMKPR